MVVSAVMVVPEFPAGVEHAVRTTDATNAVDRPSARATVLID
jgi:hypothetical protein